MNHCRLRTFLSTEQTSLITYNLLIKFDLISKLLNKDNLSKIITISNHKMLIIKQRPTEKGKKTHELNKIIEVTSSKCTK